MLPIVLTPSKVKIGLAGRGSGLERRRATLAEAGVDPLAVSDQADLEGLDLLYVAGLSPRESERLASGARALGVLVNVEDRPDICDFHVPASMRRGDLLVTISSGGRAPGLVKIVGEWLSVRFGPEWADHVESAGRKRTQWRSEAVPPAEITEKTRAIASEWLR